jgi:hypothetical protein
MLASRKSAHAMGIFRCLQRRVIGRRKSTIVGQLLYCCIFEIPNDDSPQVIQFSSACPVRVDFTSCQQLFSTHSGNPLA